MAIKIICDICGRNAIDSDEFILPMNKKVNDILCGDYYGDPHPSIYTEYIKVVQKKVNLCSKCLKTLADYIDIMSFARKNKGDNTNENTE